VKLVFALWVAVLAYLSVKHQQFVQGFLVVLLAMHCLHKAEGTSMLLIPLVVMSERCYQSAVALGHSPVTFVGVAFVSYIASLGASEATALSLSAVTAAGCGTFYALTRDAIQSLALLSSIVTGVVVITKLERLIQRSEAVIVGHLSSILIVDAVTNNNLAAPSGSQRVAAAITTFPHVAMRYTLLCVFVVAMGMSMLSNRGIGEKWSRQKKTAFFYSLFFAAIGGAFFVCYFQFEENPVVWLWAFIHSSRLRLGALLLWFTGIPLSVLFVDLFCGNMKPAARRKMFHFIAVVAFGPVAIADPPFLAMAIGTATAIGIVLEVARYHGVSGSVTVSKFVEGHIDDRDTNVVRTHLYLIFGLGCSSILYLRSELVLSRPAPLLLELTVHLLPGIVSLGIIDSFAALGGTLSSSRCPLSRIPFVCNRVFTLPKNSSLGHKTVSGLLSGFFAGSLAWALLIFVAFRAPPSWQLLNAFVAIAIAALLEVVLDAVDNLALPLAVYGMVMTISALQYSK
jgi:hypothetical protein